MAGGRCSKRPKRSKQRIETVEVNPKTLTPTAPSLPPPSPASRPLLPSATSPHHTKKRTATTRQNDRKTTNRNETVKKRNRQKLRARGHRGRRPRRADVRQQGGARQRRVRGGQRLLHVPGERGRKEGRKAGLQAFRPSCAYKTNKRLRALGGGVPIVCVCVCRFT